MSVFTYPPTQVYLAASPIQFNKNGVSVPVSIDTVTPANSNPLPTRYLDSTGAQVDLSTEATQILVKNQLITLNAKDFATSAKQDTGNTSLASIDGKLTTLNAKDFATTANQTAHSTLFGALTETAPATDTASSGLNGRLQRIAQRLTSLIALLPTSLGTKAAASSLATTWSTEDEALIGALTETAPATDTASSGLNGRLQRIAQRISSLIALFPTALGQGTMAQSFKVVVASDQSAIPVSVGSSALPTGAATSANQTSQLAQETAINTVLGTTGDAAATTDTGTFTIVSFIKRGMQNWTSLLAKIPTIGIQVSTASISVAQASDNTFKTIEQSRGVGTISNIQKSVGTTAVRATVSGVAPSARRKLIMKPSKNNTGAIFYGSSTVTIANGLEIIGPDTVIFNNESDDYFLISDTTGQVVEIIEVY